MRPSRISRFFLSFVLALAAALPVLVATSGPAAADACYTWSRTLRLNSSGSDVAQLQIRVAGWADSGVVMAIDGSFGARTQAAVTRFQRAYGLSPDGVAGPNTFAKLYELQDDDCTPAHFAYSEVLTNCGVNNYDGGSVSAATVKENLKRVMWRAEALRHQLGDHPMRVTSGFRSKACDRSVGGSGSGQHTYGTAMDFGTSSGLTLCGIARQARSAGVGGIFGPGYPDHSDHVHIDIRSSIVWSASQCGI